MLVNEPFETLVKQDTEMVQEIRVSCVQELFTPTTLHIKIILKCWLSFLLIMQTLDGEMQKLVYDNYNKFITATETIKEMKNDVYGMDPDMDAVRWGVSSSTVLVLFDSIWYSSGSK